MLTHSNKKYLETAIPRRGSRSLEKGRAYIIGPQGLFPKWLPRRPHWHDDDLPTVLSVITKCGRVSEAAVKRFIEEARQTEELCELETEVDYSFYGRLEPYEDPIVQLNRLAAGRKLDKKSLPRVLVLYVAPHGRIEIPWFG